LTFGIVVEADERVGVDTPIDGDVADLDENEL